MTETSSVEHAYRAARAFADKGELDRAAELYETFLLAHPEHTQAWLDVSRIALITGQYRAAYQFAMGLLEQDPGHAGAWLSLGLSLEKDSLPEAVEALEQAVEREPGLHLAHFHLARLRGLSGAVPAAVSAIQEALRLAPDDVDSLLLAGYLYEEVGAGKDACECWSHAIKIEPHRTDAYLALADLFTKEGQFEVAHEMIQEALVCSGSSTPLTAREVSLYALLGQGEKSLLAATRLSKRLPRSGAVWLQLGALQLQQGQVPKAEEALKEALKLDPTLWQASSLLGKLYDAAGLFDEARQTFERALERDDSHWELHNDLGLMLLEQGYLEASISCLSNAAALAPPSTSAPLFNMALACYKAEDLNSTRRLCLALLERTGLPAEQRQALESMMLSMASTE